jgi:hypothetical protein
LGDFFKKILNVLFENKKEKNNNNNPACWTKHLTTAGRDDSLAGSSFNDWAIYSR